MPIDLWPNMNATSMYDFKLSSGYGFHVNSSLDRKKGDLIKSHIMSSI